MVHRTDAEQNRAGRSENERRTRRLDAHSASRLRSASPRPSPRQRQQPQRRRHRRRAQYSCGQRLLLYARRRLTVDRHRAQFPDVRHSRSGRQLLHHNGQPHSAHRPYRCGSHVCRNGSQRIRRRRRIGNRGQNPRGLRRARSRWRVLFHR